jgi:MSHA biogenesis protein MshP
MNPFQKRLQNVARCSRARGVSLLTAVFLLVVLAALGAAIVNVFGIQQSGAQLDFTGVRADQAARSGLEWGLYRQLRVARVAPRTAADCSPDMPVTFAMPADGSLASFSVTVSCTARGNAVGNTTNRWTIEAVACNKPGKDGCPNASADADYVQRRVQAEL